MKEKIVDNPMAYIHGCIKNGMRPDEFHVILDRGIVWLENQTKNLRVRAPMPTDKR